MHKALRNFCFFGFAVLGYLQAAHSKDSCSLAAPPRDSALNMSHGAVVFIYPRSIAKGFSGCQTMWGPTGEPLVKLKLKRGALVLLEIFEHARPDAAITCRYRNGKLTTNLDDCPAYEDSVSGMKTMPVEAERRIIPPVPPETDPRRD
jgi:hypothetical protein